MATFGTQKFVIPETEIKSHKKKTRCSVCHRVLRDEQYFRCTICINFIECLECFSNGKCVDKHLPRHEMVVLDHEPRNGLTSDWNTNDEILLLGGIRRHGLGNWNVISELVGKTPIQCQTHYQTCYLDTPSAPLPDLKTRPQIPLPPPPNYSTKARESHPSERCKIHRIKPGEISNAGEYCGWMPYRHEFETEYNQRAEELVANLDFTNLDKKENLVTYIQCLQSYNKQLSERHRRTELIEKWDLMHLEADVGEEVEIDSRFLGGKTDSEKDVDAFLLPFAQYYSKERIKSVALALHNMESVQRTIASRVDWMERGVTDRPTGELFDKLKSMLTPDGRLLPQCAHVWSRMIRQFRDDHTDEDAPEFLGSGDREKKLCASLGIADPMYVALKEALLRAIAVNGRLSPEEASVVTGEPLETVRPVIELFDEFGWNR